MFAIIIGGTTFHVIFRMCRLPSIFQTTLAIYAIPQLIFMPIISVLSIPVLYHRYLLVGQVREQHLAGAELIKRLTIVSLLSNESDTIARVITFTVGLITIGMGVFFLEAYWQHYGTSRVKAYAAAAIASLVSGILITLAIVPMQSFVVYFGGG
jgi:hypothetical protein